MCDRLYIFIKPTSDDALQKRLRGRGTEVTHDEHCVSTMMNIVY